MLTPVLHLRGRNTHFFIISQNLHALKSLRITNQA
jgi:hypothetical protein